MNTELLTTRAAARKLGVGTTSIKRWADSGLLRCVRTPGGHRRFPREAVDELLSASEPQNDSVQLNDRFDSWLSKLGGATRVDELASEIKGRRDEMGAWWLVAEELAGLLVEIGARWRSGDLTILQEHIASERLARAIARTAEQIPVAEDAPVALLLVAEGEEHTLGLSLLEIVLREAGYATRWTGRRTPVELVSAHLAQADVALVAVSASEASDDRAALAEQAEILSDACHKHGVDLVLGGRGAWPETLEHGHRVHSFAHLNQVLAARYGRSTS